MIHWIIEMDISLKHPDLFWWCFPFQFSRPVLLLYTSIRSFLTSPQKFWAEKWGLLTEDTVLLTKFVIWSYVMYKKMTTVKYFQIQSEANGGRLATPPGELWGSLKELDFSDHIDSDQVASANFMFLFCWLLNVRRRGKQSTRTLPLCLFCEFAWI